METLRAEPSPGNGFAGFSGPCTGTAPCQMKLDQDQSLTATFGPPKGTAITKARLASRRSYSHLKPGRYTFKVRALDILGADANPALKRFAVKPHKTKKSKPKR